MPPVPYRKRALALAALALLGAACHPNSEISSAPEDRRRPTTPSGGLGNLGLGQSWRRWRTLERWCEGAHTRFQRAMTRLAGRRR